MDLFVLVLELLGTVAFALSGALLAARKRMDLFGMCVMGLVSACGGGVLRDMLLGRLPPVMFREPIYAAVAVAVSAAAFPGAVHRFLTKWEHLYERIMLYADTLGLGIFTAVGVTAAVQQGYGSSFFFTVFLGVMTGVGGGALRDILAGLPPYIFVRHVYACASLAGAALCAVLWRQTGQVAATLVCCGSVTLIRLLAARFRWSLPKARYEDDPGEGTIC